VSRGLELDVLSTGAQAVVGVAGEIDAATSPRLRERLVTLVSEGARDLCVNLTHTTFIDATGLDALVRAFKLLSAHGGAFSVVCPDDHLAKVFDVAHLSKDFRIYRTMEEAARAP
jgi:anti-sigma B factor antagonist